MSRLEAIDVAVSEIIPPNKEQAVTVEVETGVDEYGDYIIIYHEGVRSSKIRYNKDCDQ